MPPSRNVQIGAYCQARPESPKCVRTLNLTGRHLALQFDEIVAVIDGPAAEVDPTYKTLEAAFEGGSTKSAVVGEPFSLEGLLQSLQTGTTSVSLAAWAGSTVSIACWGGSHAHVFVPDSFGDERVESGADGRPRVCRFTVSSGDAVILLDSSTAMHVEDGEIRSVGKGGFSGFFTEEDAAVWLGTMALRGGETAGVVVVNFSKPEVSIAALPRRPTFPSLSGVAGKLPTFTFTSGLLRSARPRSIFLAIVASASTIFATSLLLHYAFARTAVSRPTASVTAPIHASGTAPIHAAAGARLSPANSTATPGGASPPPKTSEEFAQSWKFPALPNAPPGRVILTLYNPSKTAVVSQVRILGPSGTKTWNEIVAPGKTVGITLPANDVRDSNGQITSLRVESSKPIVPLRVIVGS